MQPRQLFGASAIAIVVLLVLLLFWIPWQLLVAIFIFGLIIAAPLVRRLLQLVEVRFTDPDHSQVSPAEKERSYAEGYQAQTRWTPFAERTRRREVQPHEAGPEVVVYEQPLVQYPESSS